MDVPMNVIANKLKRGVMAHDAAKKDLEPSDDTLSWMVKEASGWVETLFNEENDSQKKQNHSTKPDTSSQSTKPTRNYDVLNKAQVLQEARIFHDDIAVKHNPMQCLQILAKLLRLQGTENTSFNKSEATELFFGATKLFVCHDEFLRRFVYLFLKEIHLLCDPNDVIIVTSCLTKDMTCDIDLYRAKALCVLSHIIDIPMLTTIERYIKQAIVSECAPLATSGLVTGLRMSPKSTEGAAIVRRWIAEVQQAIKMHNGIVQFHGIMLLYQMKSTDRLAVSKIVARYTRQGELKFPLAIIMIIRYTTKFLLDESSIYTGIDIRDISTACKEGFDFLIHCLRNQSDMVVYEAARSLALLPAKSEDLHPIIGIYCVLLLSPKPCVRIGALKTVAAIADVYPALVSNCMNELKELWNDENPMIVTMVVSTLLKIASEDMIDPLIEKASVTLTNLDNEFRYNVVSSILLLGRKFPTKYMPINFHLGKFLLIKGAFEFKSLIVDGIIESIEIYPEYTDEVLFMLSKTLEACEHIQLTSELVHKIARLCPQGPSASRHVPLIYNCFLLGPREVRAAAVGALSLFAAKHRPLRSSIIELLNGCLRDDDDETRDRASNAIDVLSYGESQSHQHNIDVGESADWADIDIASRIYEPLHISFSKLEQALQLLKSTPSAMDEREPLSLENLPAVKDDEQKLQKDACHSAQSTARKKEVSTHELSLIPELTALGKIVVSHVATPLSEQETEYVVSCIKHILRDYIILQFKVYNSVEHQRLDNAVVAINPSDENEEVFEVVGEIVAPSISYGNVQSCFVVLKRLIDNDYRSCTFSCELRFTICGVDDDSGDVIGEPYEEEYLLENLEICQADLMVKWPVRDFRKSWENLGNEHEVAKKVGLQFLTMMEALRAVINFLGMTVCDNTDKVKKDGSSQVLHLSGKLLGEHPVLVRAQITHYKNLFVLKIVIRSTTSLISKTVIDWIC